ncbi:MAG: ABC transporter permease [Jatrophihabitantaceae bacterium]
MRFADDAIAKALRRLNLRAGGWPALALTVVTVAAACALSAVLIASTGGSPVDAARAIWNGSLAGATGWTTTLLYAAPLLLVAVGSCVCARAGIFNIGQEGQVLIGALAGAYAGLRLAISGPLLLVCVLVFGAVAGGMWAGLSSLMLRFRGVNVVVSTLLMTFLAQQIVAYAVNTQWFLQETPQGSSGIAGSESNPLPVGGRLHTFGGYPDLAVNVGLVIAVVGALVIAFLLARTRWGFRLKLIGLNPVTARHSGVRVALIGGLSLAVSGAFSGLAGAVLLASPIGTNRLQPGISINVGWDGLLVALIARNRPGLCLPAALLFAVLRAGGDFLAATGVPSYLADVVKALLVLALVAPGVLVSAYRRGNARSSSPLPAPVRTAQEIAV